MIERQRTIDFASIKTSEQCSELMDQLTIEIADIEGQMHAARARQEAGGERWDPVWMAAARSAARYRTADRVRLQEMRARLNKQEKAEAIKARQRQQDEGAEALLRIIKGRWPDVFYQAVAIMKGRQEVA